MLSRMADQSLANIDLHARGSVQRVAVEFTTELARWHDVRLDGA